MIGQSNGHFFVLAMRALRTILRIFTIEVGLFFRNFDLLLVKSLCACRIETTIHIICRISCREVFEVFAPFTHINSFLLYSDNNVCFTCLRDMYTTWCITLKTEIPVSVNKSYGYLEIPIIFTPQFGFLLFCSFACSVPSSRWVHAVPSGLCATPSMN